MTVRAAAVRGAVGPKEAAIHEHQPKAGEQLDDREALAVQLAERIAFDPHTVDSDFFAGLKQHFTDEEIVEMVFACSIFNWGNKFNITMQMDADEESEYEKNMTYRQQALT